MNTIQIACKFPFNFVNRVDQGQDLSYKTPYRVGVIFTGYTYWIPSYKWQTSCDVDLTYFPFDTQTCSVIFVNWIYTVSQRTLLVLSLYGE